MPKNKQRGRLPTWISPQKAAELSDGLISRGQIIAAIDRAIEDGESAALKPGIHYQISQRKQYRIYKINWKEFKKAL